MIEFLQSIDRSVFLFLNGLHASWLDGPMYWISHKLFWTPVYAFLIFILFLRFERKAFWWCLVAIALCITVNDQLASGVAKQITQRWRPSHEPSLEGMVHMVVGPDGQYYRGGDFGFYSSHAANMFGAVVFFIILMQPMKKKWTALLLVWATLVSYSRIYLGVHYPLDVLTGAIVGSIIGWATAKLYIRLMLKYELFG